MSFTTRRICTLMIPRRVIFGFVTEKLEFKVEEGGAEGSI